MIEFFNQVTSTIEENKYYYIHELSYDLIESTLTMYLCENPDDIQIELKLTFLEIQDLSNTRYHDPDDICIADMNDYSFEEREGKVYVRINTGDSNLTFVTLKKPTAERVTRR